VKKFELKSFVVTRELSYNVIVVIPDKIKFLEISAPN
jgi:hypothetical protein